LAHVLHEKIKILKAQIHECLFVGYSEESKAYRLYGLLIKHVFVNIYVNLDEISKLTTSPPCVLAINYFTFSKILKTNSTIIHDNEMKSSVTDLMMFIVKMINPSLHVNTKVMKMIIILLEKK